MVIALGVVAQWLFVPALRGRGATGVVQGTAYTGVGDCEVSAPVGGLGPTAKFAKGEASGIGKDWLGGYLCPCHGSRFDLAARVFKSQPAPTNLTVPPHQYLTDTKILIGEDKA